MRRALKLSLIAAYLALEFCGHKHFVECRPFGEARSYYGPNETSRDAIAPLRGVLGGRALRGELESFLFKSGRAAQKVRTSETRASGSIVPPMLDRFRFAPPALSAAAAVPLAAAVLRVPSAPSPACLAPPGAAAPPVPLLI